MSSEKGRLPRRDPSGREARTVQNPYFTIKTGVGGVATPQTTIVVGKAIFKKATQRNFLKRQIMSVLDRSGNFYPNLVVIIRPGVALLTKAKLKKEFSAALQKYHDLSL